MSKDDEKHTVTFATRGALRVGSFLAGIISVGWGLYVLQAVQLVATSTTPAAAGNPYTNYLFVLSSMFESLNMGVFALILALLSR